MTIDRLHCNQPDRDEPRMKCGYPLPCPHHTIVVDIAKGTVAVPKHMPSELGSVGVALMKAMRRRENK